MGVFLLDSRGICSHSPGSLTLFPALCWKRFLKCAEWCLSCSSSLRFVSRDCSGEFQESVFLFSLRVSDLSPQISLKFSRSFSKRFSKILSMARKKSVAVFWRVSFCFLHRFKLFLGMFIATLKMFLKRFWFCSLSDVFLMLVIVTEYALKE